MVGDVPAAVDLTDSGDVGPGPGEPWTVLTSCGVPCGAGCATRRGGAGSPDMCAWTAKENGASDIFEPCAGEGRGAIRFCVAVVEHGRGSACVSVDVGRRCHVM